jgi:hypothetical protein
MEKQNETILIVPRRGRPIKRADGVKNNAPIDPDYFNKYYKEKLAIKIQCPVCSEMISKSKLKQHQKTNKCINHAQCGFKCNICNKSTTESRLLIHQSSKYCSSFLNKY